MPSTPPSDGPDGDRIPFVSRWRLEGPAAASVRVSGELDLAAAPQLRRTLDEARTHARLILLDLRELSFVDCAGLHVILDASSRASAEGARLLLTGASERVESLLELTRTRNRVDVLRPADVDDAEPARSQEEGSIRPLDNPVNASVVTARVMAVSDEELWVQAANGAIHRPWSPASGEPALSSGTSIELYLDAAGAVNGWRDARTGMAINQRRLPDGTHPATYSELACHGPCGVVWRAPAADRLLEHAERCLTCAGPLVLE